MDDEPASRVCFSVTSREDGTTRLRIVETRPLEVLDLVGIPLPGHGGRTFGPALVAAVAMPRDDRRADRTGVRRAGGSDPPASASAISATPATATELAGDLPISRQAVTKHLTALADAGLLERERVGRDIRYRVTPEPLTEAVSWMAEVGGQWDLRLASLRRTFNT